MANLLHAEENHLYSFQGEAFEGFEADYNADFLSSNFDRVSPSADQVYVPYLDIDTKWRSISIAHPSPALFRAHGSVNDASKRGLVDRVDIYKNHPKKHNSNVIEIIPSNRINGINSVSKGSSGSSAPAQPFLLMPTHFETGAALDDIMLTVRKVLNEFPEISFASVAGEFSVSFVARNVPVSHYCCCAFISLVRSLPLMVLLYVVNLLIFSVGCRLLERIDIL